MKTLACPAVVVMAGLWVSIRMVALRDGPVMVVGKGGAGAIPPPASAASAENSSNATVHMTAVTRFIGVSPPAERQARCSLLSRRSLQPYLHRLARAIADINVQAPHPA